MNTTGANFIEILEKYQAELKEKVVDGKIFAVSLVDENKMLINVNVHILF